ncbi:MAG: alginate lyase family protein, partial [Flavobacterium sp.]
HWTEIETLDPDAGDIKYVWEKSRFSFLYTIIRYDYHFKQDQSEFALSEIISWIDSNPLNMGPNYTCSQELSIRMLNWIFALYYYKNSPNLTEERFEKILTSIYGQAQHVDKNLNFSLNTVRNNHAITECLLLFTVGIVFPFFEESKNWKDKGKHHLEQEGFYQIYDDGSYLQFSMNYERVVIQLYTWALYLGKVNKESFSTGLKERLNRAITFMNQCQDEFTGRLPNYGANDGALFFPLNSCSFRNYKPQLNALYYFLSGRSLYGAGTWDEDMFWFSGKINGERLPINRKTRSFETGGYHLLRDPEKFSFIRCGNHSDRPSQADNLHLDIWLKGVNILRDCGSYRYNTTPEDAKFFMGTSSHNTVMIDEYDQMEKGGRFLWYYWTQAIESKVETHLDFHIFTGKIHAFKHVKRNIYHTRTVKQFKREMKWEIKDVIENNKLPLKQIWNIYPEFFKEGFEITCKDKAGNTLEPII